jgi:hypothetical protein
MAIPWPARSFEHSQDEMVISMELVEGLPKSKDKDVILMVVDRLTKYSYFITLSHPYIFRWPRF